MGSLLNKPNCIRLISAALLVFAVVAMIACNSAEHGKSVSNDPAKDEILDFSKATQIPADWKRIETHSFEFYSPTMSRDGVSGIDTLVMKFLDDKIDLWIEDGVLGGDLKDFVQYQAGIESKVKINGVEATAVLADRNKHTGSRAVNADGSTKFETFEKNKVLGVYFPEKYTKFIIYASDEESLKTGKTILQSIRFK